MQNPDRIVVSAEGKEKSSLSCITREAASERMGSDEATARRDSTPSLTATQTRMWLAICSCIVCISRRGLGPVKRYWGVLMSSARRCDKTAYTCASVSSLGTWDVHNNFWTAKSRRELRISSV